MLEDEHFMLSPFMRLEEVAPIEVWSLVLSSCYNSPGLCHVYSNAKETGNDEG